MGRSRRSLIWCRTSSAAFRNSGLESVAGGDPEPDGGGAACCARRTGEEARKMARATEMVPSLKGLRFIVMGAPVDLSSSQQNSRF